MEEILGDLSQAQKVDWTPKIVSPETMSWSDELLLQGWRGETELSGWEPRRQIDGNEMKIDQVRDGVWARYR